jgi:hypothetical protein
VTESDATTDADARPTLDTAVRRRRADEAFFIRISKAMQQNEQALERLKR